MAPKRIVLFVEGQGDVRAAPVLLRRLISEQNGWDAAFVDERPFEVDGLPKLSGNKSANWTRWLRAAAKRGNLGGVLLLLDGDCKKFEGQDFCAVEAARVLGERAVEAGAGSQFSVASVFACCEYESWFLAGIQSIAGKSFDNGRNSVKPDAAPPNGDLEKAPRDAKGKKGMGALLTGGYGPALDQKPITEIIDLNAIRGHGMRSFDRMESAVRELIEACRTGNHVVSPAAE